MGVSGVWLDSVLEETVDLMRREKHWSRLGGDSDTKKGQLIAVYGFPYVLGQKKGSVSTLPSSRVHSNYSKNMLSQRCNLLYHSPNSTISPGFQHNHFWSNVARLRLWISFVSGQQP